MRNKKELKDTSRVNLERLIDLYVDYRQMQYNIYEQFDLLLEDPHLDELYMNVDPLLHYKRYVEEDMNGSQDRSSTTTIIKEFKALLESYAAVSKGYTTAATEV